MAKYFYSRAAILEALREGLPSDDWQQYARSRKSLHVRIHELREQGYGIKTIRVGEKGNRHATSIYRLQYEPS